jgi:hypothetical protein
MTEKRDRQQYLARRSLLAGTAGLLSGAAFSPGPAVFRGTAKRVYWLANADRASLV